MDLPDVPDETGILCRHTVHELLVAGALKVTLFGTDALMWTLFGTEPLMGTLFGTDAMMWTLFGTEPLMGRCLVQTH